MELKDSYDYIIVGSGFGGSVSALRLAEKGYAVLVIEKGKKYESEDFARNNWNLRKWFWLPALKLFGIQQLSFYRHISILSGVGVGGGSLVYANTLPKPKPAFYNHGSWAGLAKWEKELAPYYDLAWKMLGADVNPRLTESDLALKQLAEEIGKADSFEPTKVAVYFGEPGEEVDDPFFEGKGPARKGCIHCGACMTGCRHNAKNTLDKNYLYLAQKLGVDILPEHVVQDVKPLSDNGSEGYEVIFKQSTIWFSKSQRIRCKGVVFAAGVLGTLPLLLKLKKTSLPNLSPRVGDMVRSNNESLIMNVSSDKEKVMSEGIAIGSIMEVDEDSHLEPVRYGEGSGFWRLVMMPMVSEPNWLKRFGKLLIIPFTAPLAWLKVYFTRNFSDRTAVLLFMQHIDSTLKFRKGLFRMKTKIEKGQAPTAFIPAAAEMANRYARIIKAKPTVMFTEVVSGIPSTAHILGGAVMGKNASEGVIDKNNRVFGYENMFVFDGSMISANPGVNPSLSITAITERGMSKID
ncbi:MAG: GMC family oxidoreductase [Bacteroidetes bacterium]|nr:MAG: GMC family oxidoreductase [Bacteroidota bacterium]